MPRYSNLFLWIAAVAVLISIAIAAIISSDDIIPKITRDIAATSGVHPLTGSLSSIGAFLWFCTASILLFCAAIACSANNETWKFLLCGGLLSLLLCFDDQFLFHENLAPRYLGINERLVIATEALITAVYLVVFRSQILKRRPSLLAISLVFFTVAIVNDLTFVFDGGWSYFVEDGCKWLGIVAWASYHVRSAYTIIVEPGEHDMQRVR